MISENIKEQLSKSSWIRKMFEEGNRLKSIYGESNVYDFSLGNPDLEPPREVTEALRELVENPKPGMHRYMNNAGYDSVRQKIAQMLSEESGFSIPKENIVMTVGAAGALNVALKTLLDPGDEVIVLAPYFVEYLSYIKNQGGIPVQVECDTSTMLPDMDRIAGAITPKTKAIIINSPNNPSGAVYPKEVLIQLNEVLKGSGRTIYVVSDEPYKEIIFSDMPAPCTFRYIDHLVLCYSWSKTLALPGERIGFLATSPRLEDLEHFMAGAIMCNRSLGFVNAPALMQLTIEKSLGAKVDVANYQKRGEQLYQIISDAGFECIRPQGGLYLFPRSPIPDDIKFAAIAAKRNLLLVPGTGFGLQGYFRLAFCVDEGMLLRSQNAFKQAFNDCKTLAPMQS